MLPHLSFGEEIHKKARSEQLMQQELWMKLFAAGEDDESDDDTDDEGDDGDEDW